jgi:hypothetical protein
VSHSYHTDCAENTASQLVHWCMLEICCGHYLAMAVVYIHCLAMGLHVTLLPLQGHLSRIAYKHTAISSHPRAVLVMSVIGLAFLPSGLVFVVITLQLLLLLLP